MVKNKRKGSILYCLWLTKEESKVMDQELKKNHELTWVGFLIKKARRRGDFNK